jgi:hypothetical protein
MRIATRGALLAAAALAGALPSSLAAPHQPPPLASLAGLPRAPDAESRDVPAITNFWGSVGSAAGSVVGLSQVMAPPFLDVGVPTGELALRAQPACAPETAGAWSIANTEQFFSLVSANATMRVYRLSCTTACSTSWHTATATMPAPFVAFHIVFDMQPGFKPFQDDGGFDASCSVVTFSAGSRWCALGLNPSCTPDSAGVPLEGWQWTPTGVLRWGGPASSETRMLFEGNGVLQRVRVAAGAADLAGASLRLTGAVQKVVGMSWVTQPQGSTAGYASQLTTVGAAGAAALLTCRADTNTVCAVWVVASSSCALNASLLLQTAQLAFAPVPAGGTLELELALVFAEEPAAALALAASLADGGAGFAAAWDGFADGWERRWLDAFTPKPPSGGAGGHFSGSLPVLQLDESAAGTAIARLFYMGALAMLQAERTNLPIVAPRVYVTGTGNELCGISVGGSEQWAWDQTFYGQLQALLDPDATRLDLRMWVGQPIDALTGITLDDVSIQGGWYAFNAVSLYRVYSTYLRVTGDVGFLAATGTGSGSSNETVDEMLDVLADNYLRYCRPNSTLADYDGSPARYLECVPTYVHVTAGLQGGNAYMALDLADLRAAQGNASRAAALRARAAAIAAETVPALFVSSTRGARGGDAPGDVGGWFQVLDTSSGSATEVRHIVDFAYAPFGLCSPRWPPCALNASVASQMADFFLRQLALPGGAWARALSTLDGAAPVSRPDHGSTGAYAAWPAMAFDALTSLAGFDAGLAFLAGLRGADEGPFGQAHGVASDGTSVFKTTGGCNRYVANNGAAFAESVLHMVFGYEPPFAAAGDPQPALAGVPRGSLRGTLSCIRGPSINGSAPRFATATLTDKGVSYEWTSAC